MGFNQAFLRRTFELAKFSREHGNHPFAALLVIENEIVLEGVNTVCSDEDFTRHAELNLVMWFMGVQLRRLVSMHPIQRIHLNMTGHFLKGKQDWFMKIFGDESSNHDCTQLEVPNWNLKTLSRTSCS